MWKNFTLCTLLFCLLPSHSVSGQGWILLDNDTASAVVDSSQVADLQIDFVNASTSPMHLNWRPMVQDIPSMWSVSLCDRGGCSYLPWQGTMHRILMPGDTNFLHLSAIPYPSVGGIMRVVAEITDSLQPAMIQYLTFIVRMETNAAEPFARLPATRAGYDAATDQIWIRRAQGSPRVDRLFLINPQGQTYLLGGTRGAEQVRFDASPLPAGVYFLRYEVGGEICLAHRILIGR